MDTTAPATVAAISTEALEKLKTAFDAPRWAKIETQAAKQAEDLPALCTRLLATSAARYPGNDAAALYSAANRLLISLSSTLKPADVQRFENALNPAATPAADAAAPAAEDGAAPAGRKRGGKADAAPPAAT